MEPEVFRVIRSPLVSWLNHTPTEKVVYPIFAPIAEHKGVPVGLKKSSP